MAKKDYYELLGVARNASEADIKKAYRRLAMKHHPDRNPDDKQAEEKFKEINAAYETLADKQKRAYYDQFGHVDPSMGAGHSAGPGAAGFGDIFEDIFGDIFGSRRGGHAPGASAGADLQYNIELTLEQAVNGTSMNIRVPTLVSCKECNGSGARKGSTPKTCETCDGAGQVRMQQAFFSIQQTCPTCHGQGKVITDACPKCYGQGRVKEHKTLAIKIPAGVDTGDRIRLSGEGEAGSHGGPTGDLYVQVKVKPHPIFQRDGINLHCEVPISFVTAALGGEVEVPTLAHRVSLKIPAETQSGKIFRLRGQGVKSIHSRGVGDLLCTVHVETPVKLNSEQKQLLKDFEASLKKDHGSHSPKEQSWFAGVKKFFEDMKFS